jgi:hypothetical protein
MSGASIQAVNGITPFWIHPGPPADCGSSGSVHQRIDRTSWRKERFHDYRPAKLSIPIVWGPARSYIAGATKAGTVQSLMGCDLPQSRHWIAPNWVAQCGQTARSSNMSNICLHSPHVQKLPRGGAALHQGQTNPSRRGNFARRNNTLDCFSPVQQFSRMNAERTPNQRDPIRKARKINPATPTKPSSVASIKLRARPTANQSRERTI